MTSHTPAPWHPWRNSYKDTETTRTCRSCGINKPIGQFPRSGAGRRTVCGSCHNAGRRADPEDRERKRARARDLYERNPQAKIAANRRYRHRKMAAAGRPPATAPDRWYSSIRAAMELHSSIDYVVKLCRSGKLRAVKAINHPHGGYCWRIDPASISEYKRGG